MEPESQSQTRVPRRTRSLSRDSLVGQRMGFWFEFMALIASSMAVLRLATSVKVWARDDRPCGFSRRVRRRCVRGRIWPTIRVRARSRGRRVRPAWLAPVNRSGGNNDGRGVARPSRLGAVNCKSLDLIHDQTFVSISELEARQARFLARRGALRPWPPSVNHDAWTRRGRANARPTDAALNTASNLSLIS
jgi:hypothetical protein